MGWIRRALQVLWDWFAPASPDDEYTIRQGVRVPACCECGVEVKNFKDRNVVDLTEPGDVDKRVVRFGLICDSCLEVRGKVDGSG